MKNGRICRGYTKAIRKKVESKVADIARRKGYQIYNIPVCDICKRFRLRMEKADQALRI